jgi:4-amino-4-deoxy-L-arabinose transferase-like glycosyltransferase
LLGKSLGGHRAGWWSAIVLQTSLLYFVMARTLTTDIFLTQFVNLDGVLFLARLAESRRAQRNL